MEGEFRRYLADVYSTAPVTREVLTDECEVLVVSAGFAGLVRGTSCGRRLRDVRFCEKAGDVGGTRGTAIPASLATLRPTAICHCLKWAISRR